MMRTGVAALAAVMLLFGIPAFWGDGQPTAVTATAPAPPPAVNGQ